MNKKFISTSNRISRKYSRIITPDLEITLPSAPVITNVGTISGSPLVGQVLSLTGLTYTGTGTVTYQWKRDAVNISGATNSTYTLTFNDDLTNISVLVTVSNSQGNDQDTATGVDVTFAAPTSLGDFSQTITQNTLTTIYYDSRVEIQGDPNLDYCTCTLSSGTIPTGMSISGLVLTGTPTTPQVAAPVTLRYTNSGGFVDVTCNITVEEQIIAPTITSAGTITQSIIGQSSAISGFAYDGSAGTTTYQWKLNGVNISGATSSTYTPIESEDGGLLTCQITVTNSADSDTSTTASSTIVYAAPQSSGNISSTLTEDVAGSIDYTTQVSVSGDADLSGGSWAVQSGTIPDGMTRTGGVVSGTPTTPQSAADLVLRYTNSGGFVDVTCSVTVSSGLTAPTITSAGTVSGAVVGEELVVSGASYTGSTGVETYQWTSAGVDIPGATYASYVPATSDLGQQVARRMTVTNGAGTDMATSTSATVAASYDEVTFDALTKTSAIIITNGNEVTTSTSVLAGVRTERTIEKGQKVYFEIAVPGGSLANAFSYFGLTHYNAAMTPGAGAAQNFEITYVRANGGVTAPAGWGDGVANACDLVNGDVVRIAVNRVTNKVYFGTNAGWTGDPVAGTGGFDLPNYSRLLPHLNPRASSQAKFTLRSLPNEFSHTAPSGYTAYGRISAHYETNNIAKLDEIVEMTGINVHLNWTTTFWATDVWKAPLYDLGVRYIRTAVGTDSTARASMIDAYSNGLKATVHVAPADNDGTNFPVYDTTKIDNQIASIPVYGIDSVIGIEGPNEPNGGAVTAGWDDRATAAMQYVYDEIKGDPALDHLPVLAITPWKRSPSAYTAMGSMAGMSDGANLHYYTDGSRPTQGNNESVPYLEMDECLQDALDAVSPGDPIWVTEYGHRTYDDTPDLTQYTPEKTVAAKYIVRGLFEWYIRGVEKVFIYNLIDDPTTLDGYGLIAKNASYDFVKRPAYYAIQRLMALFDDGGASFSVTPLRWHVSGNLSDVGYHMFQKSDGKYYLVLWQNAQSWNRSTISINTITPRPITVAFEKPASSVRVYLPTTASGSTLVANDVMEFEAAVPDEVAVYEITV